MARRAVLRLCFGAAALCATSRASAQEQFGPSTAPPAPGGTEQAVVARYWELGRVRPFLSASIEAGYAYLRPRFTAGYGRPFWSWLGVEAYPLLSVGGVGHYSGVMGALPGLTLRLGGRYFYPLSRSFLLPRESFERSDTELLQGPRAEYVAFEGELTGTFPLFNGSAFAVLTGYRTALVPEGYYLFEESLRAVMDPPYILRARLGYLLALNPDGAIRVGVTGETIALPGRDEIVVRGGVLGSVLISAQLEAQVSLIPVLVSPDQLGLMGGDFGQLGVLYRWATASTPVAPKPKP